MTNTPNDIVTVGALNEIRDFDERIKKQIAIDELTLPPVLNKAEERKKSIIEDTPAIFNITDNPKASGSEPFYELALASEVKEWCTQIIEVSHRRGLDPELVMAIMYMETTHGWYDAMYPFRKTILPMNIHYEYWRKMGVTPQNLAQPAYNIEFGAILLQRIKKRLASPTIAKIATIYNFLGAEKVSEYGARVARLYWEKPWRKEGCN